MIAEAQFDGTKPCGILAAWWLTELVQLKDVQPGDGGQPPNTRHEDLTLRGQRGRYVQCV